MGRNGRLSSRYRWLPCATAAVALHAAAALAFGAPPARSAADATGPAPIWLDVAVEPGPGDRPASGTGTEESGSRGTARPDLAPPTPRRRPQAVSRSEAPDDRRHRVAWRKAAPRTRAPAREREARPSDGEGVPKATGTDGTEAAGGAGGGQPASGGSGARGSGGNGRGSGGGAVRAPRLLARGDPCAGYFPIGAVAKRGQVQLDVTVDAQGHPRGAQVLAEMPGRQGFGPAARACARRLHFAPAHDDRGHAVSWHATIRVRFARSAH